MQHILQHLFKAETLGEVPRERLEALVEEHPSFSIARYLLSSKLRAENADHFAEETRKTNLYFSNPFWLQWLLQQEEAADAKGEVHVAAEPVKELVKEPVKEPVEQTAPAEWQEVTALEEHRPHAAEFAEQVVTEQEITEQGMAEQEAPPGYHEPQQQTAEPAMPAVIVQSEEPAAMHEATPTSPSPPVGETAKTEENTVEPPLVFESYHMIDYFASQGIKLSPDENPSDRLGKQMKSFTEWLKVMKRLPQKEVGIVPDIVAENKVQAIAAYSIEGREVVTETMAEVLAKQGMREKASEVYHKLSLLNPDKSGYFAAKIEELKTN